ncbi:MAG TPA: tRNA (adenosine(37)-N6)-threonylcarbamoyltransferase complex transferase subunit TsaD [Candidatus Anaerotruncus excrementipullorum]|uniref:tRNA N6-adenosine threonylcarbamoyltransferase n=1 Tax=Candidatus Anaerotruncus excrementipullorum TaxID=2838465 RepID=A0A9D1WPV2_9FIRM|nr:tRNA (adenosine(37)-N6)-threonylcarbamoyltransferase complex transferase subunit TsaD [Candidatus Anaerotruncus excrementipullorum]
MKILAIESSCDETAAALVENGRQVRSSVVNTQIPEHQKYGGVVPEIASRRHIENIVPVVDAALQQADCTLAQVDAIAVTAAPGLIGALLVGTNYAKGLALAAGKPLIPVHHIRGHIAANYLAHPQLTPPFLCLVASGGHTLLVQVEDYTRFTVLGTTRDDAAGEAFDKSARAMGFPYPGGKYLDAAAHRGDPSRYKLPHPKVEGSSYDFSFSGLKTAVINLLHNAAQKGEAVAIDDLAASFQQTVCQVLTGHLERAALQLGVTAVAAAGGVCANSGLRASLEGMCARHGWGLYLPPLPLCGDNAAMIGAQAYYEYLAYQPAGMDLNAAASMDLEEAFTAPRRQPLPADWQQSPEEPQEIGKSLT